MGQTLEELQAGAPTNQAPELPTVVNPNDVSVGDALPIRLAPDLVVIVSGSETSRSVNRLLNEILDNQTKALADIRKEVVFADDGSDITADVANKITELFARQQVCEMIMDTFAPRVDVPSVVPVIQELQSLLSLNRPDSEEVQSETDARHSIDITASLEESIRILSLAAIREVPQPCGDPSCGCHHKHQQEGDSTPAPQTENTPPMGQETNTEVSDAPVNTTAAEAPTTDETATAKEAEAETGDATAESAEAEDADAAADPVATA